MSHPGHYFWIESSSIIPNFQFKVIVYSFQPDPHLTGLGVAGDIGEGFVQDTEQMIAGLRRGTVFFKASLNSQGRLVAWMKRSILARMASGRLAGSVRRSLMAARESASALRARARDWSMIANARSPRPTSK